ncbi:molybdate ABC transporter substrate-binding protein [Herbiconiux sp. CPCC 203407]|uniref:Molybdate ABC transporter substrate-binding protein n=1 Tax=Herbiconiux oxytropis TaxID=2970915 RepID=A0AA41XC12_9MICO|nr:molybdate ABC transporter substrate-binding protein [Herbiconiux oxytropis]MCS5724161.1 molybdate ABC transporter substrate-binding protein [Herbiconiux oxytropis]MCS5725454.1 molybdate ABC transporter substrate-binding protein [Herbiconiux oxytropis]
MLRSTRRRALPAVAVLGGAAAIALSGCASGGAADGAAQPPESSSASALEGSITVFAAASLKGTFTELADEFEAEHPGLTVELTFAGSSDLVTQIAEGAPADVFASADENNMAKLVDEALIGPDAPVEFATNVLQIAVPPANPQGIETLADLARAGVAVVVCAPQVPCGAAAAAVETAAGVDIAPVSEESSVTDVLGKVTSGEADAGLVYLTDVIAAGDAVRGIAFPESAEAVNVYPIAPVTDGQNPEAALAFIDFVTGAEGRAVLEAAGFGAAP